MKGKVLVIASMLSFGCGLMLLRPVLSKPQGRKGAPRKAANALSAQEALAKLQAERDGFWRNAKREVDKSVLELLAQHQAEVDRGLRFRKLMRGDPDRKEIALTFDDGPHPNYTPRILDILRQYRVRATFFLVGEMAEKYPALVRAEVAQGHNIGNHTYHHVSLVKIPKEYIAAEIKACGKVIQKITGRAPHLFRPPGGEYDKEVAEASDALGYTMVLWTDDPGDYASPGQQLILTRTLSRVTNGGIILLHDGIQQTIDVLPGLIERLREQGYTFVTVDEMLAKVTVNGGRTPHERP